MWSARAALLICVFAGMTTNGFAAAPEGTAAPPKDTASTPSPSLDVMVGKKLIAIDGPTIETISISNDSCTAWYPEGHVFSLDERRAALTQFATKLGLADPVDKKT